MDVVLLGAPGAGKGTQAKAIAAELGVAHVATGDLFREAVQRNTPLGREVRGYMDRGELVPDDLTIAILADRIAQPDAARGILLDGFPRTVAQADALDMALMARRRRVDKAIYLAVPTAVLINRLAGRWLCRDCQTSYHEVYSAPTVAGRCDHCNGELYQRPDDRRETVERRLEVYFQQTVPVIDYYRRRGMLVEIYGDLTIEAVQQDLESPLRRRSGLGS